MSLRWRLALLAGLSAALGAAVVFVVFVAVSCAPDEGPADTFARAVAEFELSADRANRQPPPAVQARRALFEQLRTPDGRSFEQVLDDLDDEQRTTEVTAAVTSTAIAVAALTVASVAAAWLVARRVLRQVRTLTDGARRAASLDLSPIELDGPGDELRELGDTMDQMLARVETALDAYRHFAIDVAHELRGPIAAIRSNAELALTDHDARDGDRTTLIEAERCARIIDRFLMTAQMQTVHTLTACDLADIAADVVGRQTTLASEHRIQLTVELADAPVLGDPVLLGALIENLFRNAIVHNVPGGTVDMNVATSIGTSSIVVANTGQPVPDAGRLLRRHVSGSDHGGTGVGLSIVASIVELHHGTLRLDPRDGGGLCVTVELPRPPADAATSVRPGSQRDA